MTLEFRGNQTLAMIGVFDGKRKVQLGQVVFTQANGIEKRGPLQLPSPLHGNSSTSKRENAWTAC
jgi:hypothetical protein